MADLTDQSSWVADNWKCPVCRSDNLETTGMVAVEDPTATREVSCRACKSKWDEIYELSGYDLKHNGRKNVKKQKNG